MKTKTIFPFIIKTILANKYLLQDTFCFLKSKKILYKNKDFIILILISMKKTTPTNVVEKLLNHLDFFAELHYEKLNITTEMRKNLVVWCPFDNDDSEYVKQIRAKWYTVVNDVDYFTETPKKYDVIISTIFSDNKRKIFERALSLWKPFAFLTPLSWLTEVESREVFFNNELELLMFDKNIEVEWKAYFCNQFLENVIMIEKL